MNKNFITSQALLQDSFRLAAKVYDDGFRPDFIIGIWRGGAPIGIAVQEFGIWRGGAPIGIAVQEFFEFKDYSTDHIAVRTSSYYGINKQSKEIRVHGLHYLVENADAEHKLLIVDDVFDSGRSVDALIQQIRKLMRLNMPKDIRIACPWYKPQNNTTDIVPDYYVNESDEWLVFPHEIAGLSEEEIREGKGELADVMDILFDKK